MELVASCLMVSLNMPNQTKNSILPEQIQLGGKRSSEIQVDSYKSEGLEKRKEFGGLALFWVKAGCDLTITRGDHTSAILTHMAKMLPRDHTLLLWCFLYCFLGLILHDVFIILVVVVNKS